ncbi:MAG: acyl-CoA dehydrogenase family protein, partial [bacterium]
MSIYDSEDLKAIRQQTRRFVEEKVLPQADEWEQAGRVPPEILKEMGAIGFFGLRVPEEYGGVGLGPLASVAFAEELGRSTYGGFSITALAHCELAMPYVLNFGSAEQKERWLPAMVAGETITAIAVTEPDAGSDVAAIRTRAARDGEGWRIDGSKMFITNGGIADLVFVGVRTNPDVKGSRGLSIIAVPREAEGFTVSRALPKMGWH